MYMCSGNALYMCMMALENTFMGELVSSWGGGGLVHSIEQALCEIWDRYMYDFELRSFIWDTSKIMYWLSGCCNLWLLLSSDWSVSSLRVRGQWCKR